MITYDSADIFIESGNSLQDKIAKIDLVIDALLSSALKAAATGAISQYSLNDGQTVISQGYRDPAAIEKSIMAFERIKKMYIRQLNGASVIRLVDEKTFTNRNGYGNGR